MRIRAFFTSLFFFLLKKSCAFFGASRILPAQVIIIAFCKKGVSSSGMNYLFLRIIMNYRKKVCMEVTSAT